MARAPKSSEVTPEVIAEEVEPVSETPMVVSEEFIPESTRAEMAAGKQALKAYQVNQVTEDYIAPETQAEMKTGEEVLATKPDFTPAVTVTEQVFPETLVENPAPLPPQEDVL
jgi:hypothetical protein